MNRMRLWGAPILNLIRGLSAHRALVVTKCRKTPGAQPREAGLVKALSPRSLGVLNRIFVCWSRLKDFLKDGKYNIIRIISDPNFLVECYHSIKSNPDNMTKGFTNKTLDGITFSYFEKLAKDMFTGKLKLSGPCT